ncbi:MAG: DUF3800 domain-containing protein [Candidatus Levyibacteriota bacterium]
MKNYKLLSIDETGKANYSHPSKIFIISGVIIPEKLKPKITTQIRKIKRKYLKNPDIVFHSRDMHRAKGQFAGLRDEKVATAFWNELIEILKHKDITAIFIVVDKVKAKKKGWQTQTILQRTYVALLEEFVEILKQRNDNGKIIVESDPYQDAFLIYAHNRLQSTGTTLKTVKPKEYQQMVTSLSLVNKENLDIDIQIADMLAFVAGVKYEREVLHEERTLTEPERMKLALLEEKVAKKDAISIFKILL